MSTATRPRRRPGARAARRLARPPRRLSPRARRRLFATAIAGLLLAGLYVAVIRDLPAFRIETVDLSGASSAYEPRLRAELEAAARTMTTLHVEDGRLREVAGRYPAVVSLKAAPELPHDLRVRVVERPPVGTVEGSGGRRVPVAADGTVLEGQPVDRPLPALPGRAGAGGGAERAATATAARLAAAAPRPLAAWLEEVRRGPTGWVVKLRRGPELRFGSLADLAEKWSAAAGVLRADRARGAGYLDLRLPERPAAGGFAPGERSESTTPAEPPAGDDTVSGTNPQP